MKRLAAGLAVVLLSVCVACTRSARLYNLTTGDVTTAQYSYSGSGKGRIWVNLASGEHLKGEYATIPGGEIGWGSIYAAVYGAGGAASGSAISYSAAMESKQHGTAVITGNKGTVVQCEYVTSVWNGAGAGACKDNHGTLYRLMF
jgi:hypothetical protein